jgi:transaldolase / glucose-6-phosphate isomerase
MSKVENPLKQVSELGQSVWLDYIRRHLLSSAEFKRMLAEDGLSGMTSNPTIFEKAIAGSTDYDEQLADLVRTKKDVGEIYEALTIADIRAATDALRPLYDQSGGRRGFVSYEVSPLLANDTEGTLKAARRYIETIGRPNVLIKVPATPAGVPAIEQLISEGHNINVTLMFSMSHYEAVAEAYIRGLERRLRAGGPVDRVASVASFFVSRVETLVDRMLDEKLKASPEETLAALKGAAAVANAKLVYQRYKEIFDGNRFADLKRAGAHPQQVLWASTGTKDPAYSDIKYVQDLIGPNTVNTMPPATMDAFRDHGQPRLTLEEDVDGARDVVRRLAAVGIDLNEVGEELQREGVQLFVKSFDDLLAVIEARRDGIVASAGDGQKISTPGLEEKVAAAQAELQRDEFAARLWHMDASLWKKDPKSQEVIRNALGWLTVAETMSGQVAELRKFAEEVRQAGLRNVVLLGMGGSSLCPELFARTFSSGPGYPRLHVLDTTVPDCIRSVEREIDPGKTLFVVSSKSGGTIETLSHYKHFFEATKKARPENPGANFVAITDPGTGLEKLASENRFRRVFLNPHDIGGRYSALSYFGLVPAALIGMDLGKLLDRAVRMMHSTAGCVRTEENPGLSLGAALGALKRAGRDKMTFIVSPGIGAFGLWVEQLIAESTGKEGTGLVPVCDEPIGAPPSYGRDRVLVYVQLRNGADESQERGFRALGDAGMPTVLIPVADKIDLGGEFLRWEIATATAGALLGINAFDQPNVQESKDNTNRLLATFERSGGFKAAAPAAEKNELALYLGSTVNARLASARGFDEMLRAFFALGRPGDYVAIMAYVAESSTVEREISAIRAAVRDRTHLATTFGYGPRFLHSTGQLHKGGPDTGLFIQVTQENREHIPIPGQKYDFAVLNQAQHLGDFQSLETHGRRVVRVHIRGDVEAGVASLGQSIARAVGAGAA